jgi:hypothetical protein
MSDPARRPEVAAPAPTTPPPDRLWFLSVPDEFLRRFVLRTVLQPPPSVRRARPPWLRR